MTTAPKGQPRWHPISALPLVAKVIDEGLTAAEDQYRLLLEAKHLPRVLDDHTVERTLRVFGDTHDDLWVFEAQLARWSKTALTPRQRAEVDRLILQQRTMREVVDDILALADDLKAVTIEAVLAKSDFDLALEAFFGGHILHQRPPTTPPTDRARDAAGRLGCVQGSAINPDELINRYTEEMRTLLRPSADFAVQLVGLRAEVAKDRADRSGFMFVSIPVPDGGRVALTADLRIGRIRGFVRDGVVFDVQVG